jgi:transposase
LSWPKGWLHVRWVITSALGLALAVGILLRLDHGTSDQLELIQGEAPNAENTYMGFLADGRIDLNAASVDLLTTLPGIGEITADEIARARAQRRFASVEELADCCQLSASEVAEIEKFAGVR